MKVIGFEDVRDAGIDPAECVRWVEEALRLKAGAVLPAKTSMKPGVRGGVSDIGTSSSTACPA